VWLIVGLGNPEVKYFHNRHNTGYLVVNSLAKNYNSNFHQSKFLGQITRPIKSSVSNLVDTILILKPITYMNNSGQSIQKAISFYKILPAKIVIIHDDIDLPFGDIRVKFGGGDAGHKGLVSITNYLGANYWRIRIGVDRPLCKSQVSNYVLSDFTDDQFRQLDTIIDKVKFKIAEIVNN
jgi:PTH1 family peptidyl-tRNA hydrolase